MSKTQAINLSDDDDTVLIGRADVSNYNDDNILPVGDQLLADIRSWIDPTDYDAGSGEYRKHLASRFSGTGEWLPATDNYKKWHDDPESGLLWIKGIPGSGKSVFAASLANRLAQEDVPVLYFFFRLIIEANHQPANLLRDWLAQLLPFSPPLQHVLKGHLEKQRAVDTLTTQDLWSLLRNALAYLPQAYCVVDALDEMDQGNGDFIESLAHLARWRPSKVKVLITSRPVFSVEHPMRRVEALHLRLEETHVDRDIALYVHQQLEYSSLRPFEKNVVKEAVPGRANGIFLYAKLAMQIVLESGDAVRKVVAQLPSTLNELYTEILEEHSRRSGINISTQLMILKWATHATRPLRLIELADILYTLLGDLEEMDIKAKKTWARAACGPLIEILPDERISVVHHSFTEFLTGKNRKGRNNARASASPTFDLVDTHRELALACLKYLRSGCLAPIEVSMPGLETSLSNRPRILRQSEIWPKVSLASPFALYAVENWYKHAAKGQRAVSSSDTLLNDVKDFFAAGEKRHAWLTLTTLPFWTTRNAHLKDAHIAAFCGLWTWIAAVLTDGPSHETKSALDSTSRTPMWYAADAGHLDVVKMLLVAEADFTTSDNRHEGPIHRAARRGHVKIMSTLIAAGADPFGSLETLKPGGYRDNNSSAFHAVCKEGNIKMLSILLRTASIEVKQEALLWAAHCRRPKILRILLQQPDMDAEDGHAKTLALRHACSNGDMESIRLLLKHGAHAGFSGASTSKDVTSPDDAEPSVRNRGDTPLHAFCRLIDTSGGDQRGSVEPKDAVEGIRLLLQAGADVRQKDKDGKEAIHHARSASVMGALLDAGADPNATDVYGETRLHGSFEHSNGCSQLLVEAGADLGIREHIGGKTPLLKATSFGQRTFGERRLASLQQIHVPLKSIEWTIDLSLQIIARRTDISETDWEGNNAMHLLAENLASSPRALQVTAALYDMGVDFNGRNHEGMTPLHVLAKSSAASSPIMDYMISHGSQVDAQDHQGRTALSLALAHDISMDTDLSGFNTLWDAKRGPEYRDARGRNLAHEAFLLDLKMSPFDPITGTVCQVAPRLMHIIKLGVSPLTTDFQGNTLVHQLVKSLCTERFGRFGQTYLAALPEHLDFLAAIGLDIDQANYAEATPLRLAAQYSSEAATEYARTLIERSTTLDKRDGIGFTPLHAAAAVSQGTFSLLLSNGTKPPRPKIDVRATTRQGTNVLHIAAMCRQSNVVGMVLDYVRESEHKYLDLFVNQVDQNDNTPLTYACRSGRPETVELLLKAGANPNPRRKVPSTRWFSSTDPSKVWFPPIFQCLRLEGNQNHRDAARSNAIEVSDVPPHSLAYDGVCTSTSQRGIKPEIEYIRSDVDTLRFDEILRMLLAHGADPFVESSISDGLAIEDVMRIAAYQRLDYVVGLFFPIYQKAVAADKLSALPILARMSLARLRAEELTLEEEHKAPREFSYLLTTLLFYRRYDLIKELTKKSVDFTVPSSRWPSALHLFASNGFADLLDHCSTPTEAQRTGEGLGYESMAGRYTVFTQGDLCVEPVDTLLAVACGRDLPNVDVLCVLVEKKDIDVNCQARSSRVLDGESPGLLVGESALHILASGNSWWHSAVGIPYLVSKGADVETRDTRGRTPLHRALAEYHCKRRPVFREQASRMLVQLGADVNAVTNGGRSCLDLAGDSGLLIRLLTSRGATVNRDAINSAINRGNVEGLEALLQSQTELNFMTGGASPAADSDKPMHHPLVVAAGTSNGPCAATMDPAICRAMMQLLLDKGANPLDRYTLKRHSVTSKARTTRAPSLREKAASFWGTCDDAVLRECMRSSDADRALLEEELPPGDTASQEHHYDVTCSVAHEILMAGTAFEPILALSDLNIEACDAHGLTLFLAACRFQCGDPWEASRDMTSAVKGLLDRGADPLAVDNAGRNALHHLLGCYARIEDKQRVLEMLEKHIPDLVNKGDIFGLYPAHYVFSAGMRVFDQPCLDYLLSHGLDPLCRDGGGNTLLHYVTEQPQWSYNLGQGPEFFGRLVQLGVPINGVNHQGQTPLHVLGTTASWRPQHFEEMRRLFDEGGADWRATDARGRTVLHYKCKERDAFEWALDAGADAFAEDEDGMTSLDIAAAHGSQGILDLFDESRRARGD